MALPEGVAVALDDGGVALVAADGAVLWSEVCIAASDFEQVMEGMETWLALPLAFTDDAVLVQFVSTARRPGGFLFALSRDDGAELWRVAYETATYGASGVAARLVVRDGVLVSTGADAILVTYDAATGEELDRRPTEAGGVLAALTSRADGSWIAQKTTDGTLVTFSVGADGAIADWAEHPFEIDDELEERGAVVSGEICPTRPVDAGSFIVCRVPTDEIDDSRENAMEVWLKPAVGTVDAEDFHVIDVLEGVTFQQQPVLMGDADACALLYAADDALWMINIKSGLFGEPERLDIAVHNDLVVPEPLWLPEVDDGVLLVQVDEEHVTSIR